MRVWKENPWYWEYGRKPVLLLGGADEDNLFNHPDLARENLVTLESCGGNYLRLALSSRGKDAAWPYERTPGGYDLYRFDREYWQRLAGFLKDAAARRIVVQVEIWSTADFYADAWAANPFNPAQNVNYTAENVSLSAEWPYSPDQRVQSFFRSAPALDNDEALLAFQSAFVDKVLEVTLPLDNVLYCLDSETAAPREWAWFWGEYVNREAARRGYEVNLTEMWFDAELRSGRHKGTYTRPDIFNYVEISQNNMQSARAHWDSMMWMRKRLSESEAGPRPLNNAKVYAFGPAGGLDIQAASERFWQNLLGGSASSAFHKTAPNLGIGLNSNAQAIIRAARAFTNEFSVFRAAPRQDLVLEAPPAGAYCMAEPGKACAVYFPEGSSATIDLSGAAPAMVVKWFDPRRAVFLPPRAVQGGRRAALACPDADREWLALIEALD